MDYYNEIKNELIDIEVYTRIKDYSKNKYQLEKYYNVGKLLIEAQGGIDRAKYGDGLIKEYSKRLTTELGKGYSERNLKYMRKFYLYQIGQPLSAQLSWSHYLILLSIKDINKINYYIEQISKRNLSKRQLKEIIGEHEYERLPEETRLKLITKEDISLIDSVKNPIIIKNMHNTDNISEKMLKVLILDNITNFMKELGEGFSFIDSEYKIMLGTIPNYIDLLLFNYKHNAFVVVELKITELKKEHIGQIQVYMNYIDNNLRKVYHDKTIGIIICRKDNKYIIEYCSDKRIISRTYELI